MIYIYRLIGRCLLFPSSETPSPARKPTREKQSDNVRVRLRSARSRSGLATKKGHSSATSTHGAGRFTTRGSRSTLVKSCNICYVKCG